MYDILDKTDGVSTLSASEFNSLKDELENIVTSTGITLSSSDNFQIAKSVANYISAGDFYTESGTANAYVLSPVSSRKAPTAYVTGMRVRFFPGNANSGASTINVSGLGVKNIKNFGGTDLAAGVIRQSNPTELFYDGTQFIYPDYAQGDARYLQLSNYPDIRFRATLTSDVVIATSGTNIVFNNVIENVGGAYNSSNGRFQPSVHGLYLIECGLGVQSPNAANNYISYSMHSDTDGELRGVDIFCLNTGATPSDGISCLVNLDGVNEYAFIKAISPSASLALGQPQVSNFSATLIRKLS